MTFNKNFIRIIGLSLGFTIFVIFSTLIHEIGHFSVSKFYKNTPTLNYNSTKHLNGNKIIPLQDSLRFIKNLPEITKINLRKRILQYRKEKLYTRIGGPFTNVFIGTFGFITLLLLKNKSYFKRTRWIFMFLTIFWARQTIIFPMSIFFYLKNNKIPIGDEEYISKYFSLPFYSLSLLLFLISIIILSISFLIYFNRLERFCWITSCIIGGTIGIILWFKILGPFIL